VFWSHLRSFVTTTRPKHSLNHNLKSETKVLTGNRCQLPRDRDTTPQKEMSMILRKSINTTAVAGLLALVVGLSLPPSLHAKGKTYMTGSIAEIVTFKLAKGVNEATFLEASQTAEAFMRTRKGFISRRLTRNADGVYTDYVLWENEVDAKAAMEASMTDARVGPFVQSIDGASMKADHQQMLSQIN
jgi:hypothetical protein